MNLKFLVIILILHQAWMINLALGNCDSFSVGQVTCIPAIEGYSDSQWATCLSNSYIQEKSQGRHICEVHTATYCYYQCQLETYGFESGAVFGKCKCDSNDYLLPGGSDSSSKLDYLRNLLRGMNPTTTRRPDNPIASWCTSPDGTECLWYRECLNKKYPCQDSENGYTLEYTERFCNTQNHYADPGAISFSTVGSKWVYAVRKCLQVALVPLIRPWMSPTCKDIKQTALNSQAQCYLSAYPGAPSMCDLSCTDWAKFFWTAKSGDSFQWKSFVETMKSAVEVMSTCGKNASIVGTGCPSEILRLTLKYEKIKGYKTAGDQHARDVLAGDATDQLAKRLKWEGVIMGWFAYAPNITQEDSDLVTIHVILGDNFVLGLTGQQPQSRISLTGVVSAFIDALQQGQLYDLDVYGGSVSVVTLEACGDMQCEETYMKATAGPRPTHKPQALKKNFATTAQPQVFTVWLYAVILLIGFFF